MISCKLASQCKLLPDYRLGGGQMSVDLPVAVLGSWFPWKTPSRLSFFLHRNISTSSSGSTTRSTPGPRCRRTRSSRSGPGPSSRCSSWCSSCSSSAQYSGDLSLHEGPRGTVGRVIQWTAISAGAVHLPIAPPALDVHSGAGEAEPKFGGGREDRSLQFSGRCTI